MMTLSHNICNIEVFDLIEQTLKTQHKAEVTGTIYGSSGGITMVRCAVKLYDEIDENGDLKGEYKLSEVTFDMPHKFCTICGEDINKPLNRERLNEWLDEYKNS